MYIVIIILAVIPSYKVISIKNYCNNLQQGFNAILAFFFSSSLLLLSIVRVIIQWYKREKKKIAKSRDYIVDTLLSILRFSTTISKALNFPLWFESRAPWTIFNFSPPPLPESLWRMTNGVSRISVSPIRTVVQTYPSAPVNRQILLDQQGYGWKESWGLLESILDDRAHMDGGPLFSQWRFAHVRDTCTESMTSRKKERCWLYIYIRLLFRIL